jgi:hypothetical protein
MREIEMNTKRGGWTDANSCQVRSAFLNYYLCCGSILDGLKRASGNGSGIRVLAIGVVSGLADALSQLTLPDSKSLHAKTPSIC